MLAMTGFQEGSIYNSGAGVTYIVSRYVPGADFGTRYGMQVLSRFCSGQRVTNAQQRPDLAAIMTGMGYQTTAAEIHFMCDRNGVSMSAVLYSATTRMLMPAVGPGAGI
jgi:hypothetical protein